MNVVDVCNTVNEYLVHLRNERYGDNIEYIEAYDGKLIIHFKKEYIEEKIAEMLISDLIQAISKTIWGGTNDK